MKRQLSILLPLALIACGEGVESYQPGSITDEVATLSLEAAEEPFQAAEEVPEVAASEPIQEAEAVPESLEAMLAVEPEEEAPSSTFTLRHGETLAHFARWSELPVEEIAAISDLDLGGVYPVGTEVRVPVSGEQLTALEMRREAHSHRRVDGYLASRGGSIGTEFYDVRTGDTAWDIARSNYGMPLWMLEAYNPSVDLDNLRPGQSLMLPVLADTIVDAGPQ